MANLIEQMNILKGLTDEHLQMELKSPTGGAAPFMVASEVARRKDMRQRYEAEAARKKPSTTVLDDLTSAQLGGMPGMGGSMTGAPPGTGGITDAAPPAAAPGFASGGIIDYNDIATRYNDRLEGLGGDIDRARRLAFLAAGAGIMGAGHSNTLQNVGIGLDAGVTSYSDALKTIDSEELGLLRGITDIGQAQHADQLSQMDRDLRERELAQQKTLAEERLSFDKRPAALVKLDWIKAHPEDKDLLLELDPPYNPNALTNDMRVADAINEAFDTALKTLPPPVFVEPGKEQETALIRQKQAALLAYPRWVTIAGVAAANQKAKEFGLTDGDILTLSTPSAPATDGADPLQLGL